MHLVRAGVGAAEPSWKSSRDVRELSVGLRTLVLGALHALDGHNLMASDDVPEREFSTDDLVRLDQAFGDKWDLPQEVTANEKRLRDWMYGNAIVGFDWLKTRDDIDLLEPNWCFIKSPTYWLEPAQSPAEYEFILPPIKYRSRAPKDFRPLKWRPGNPRYVGYVPIIELRAPVWCDYFRRIGRLIDREESFLLSAPRRTCLSPGGTTL